MGVIGTTTRRRRKIAKWYKNHGINNNTNDHHIDLMEAVNNHGIKNNTNDHHIDLMEAVSCSAATTSI
jgi:hypothetical protein